MFRKVIYISLLLFATPAMAQDTAAGIEEDALECVPACRAGFICMGGQCISACNPPCAAGETCNEQGQCIAPPTSSPIHGTNEPSDYVSPQGGLQYDFSAVGGLLMEGSVWLAGNEVDTDSGLVFRLAIDSFLMPKFSMGAYILNASTSVGDFDMSMTALGGVLKGCFGDPKDMQFRVGLALAYQMSDVEGGSATDEVTGFGVAPVVELAIPVAPTWNVLVHGSFISQPAGGNDVADVTWAPIIYFGAGIEYAE